MDLSDHQICDLERFQEAKLIEPLGRSPGKLVCAQVVRGPISGAWAARRGVSLLGLAFLLPSAL